MVYPSRRTGRRLCQIYRRIAHFKNLIVSPLKRVLLALLQGGAAEEEIEKEGKEVEKTSLRRDR
jgi:hypothetical protein